MSLAADYSAKLQVCTIYRLIVHFCYVKEKKKKNSIKVIM